MAEGRTENSETVPPGGVLPPSAPKSPPPEAQTPAAIRALMRGGRMPETLAALSAMPPLKRAEIFVRLRGPEQAAILAAAKPTLAASLLADRDSATLAVGLARVDPAPLAPAFALVPPDDLADLLLHLPAHASESVQALLEPALREEALRLMQFEPDTAGGLMTTRCLSVPDAVTAGRALELLRTAQRGDAASYVYAVDANGRLAGTVPLRKLLLADPRKPIRDLASGPIVRLKTSARRDEIVGMFRQHHFLALPVVDEKDRLAGIVTFDDAFAAEREAEEQAIHGMTGADPREALRGTFAAARGRVPWVTVTLLGGLGCAAIGALFREVLEAAIVLGLFVPIVLAMAESVGAQTISVVLGAHAAGGVSRSELASFVLKEFLVGVLVGLYAGVLVAGSSLLWHGNPRLGLLIGGAVFATVAWAAALAVLVPILLRRLRVSPEVASGPLVLAMADVSTLLVYLGGAALLLPFTR